MCNSQDGTWIGWLRSELAGVFALGIPVASCDRLGQPSSDLLVAAMALTACNFHSLSSGIQWKSTFVILKVCNAMANVRVIGICVCVAIHTTHVTTSTINRQGVDQVSDGGSKCPDETPACRWACKQRCILLGC